MMPLSSLWKNPKESAMYITERRSGLLLCSDSLILKLEVLNGARDACAMFKGKNLCFKKATLSIFCMSVISKFRYVLGALWQVI